MSASSQSRWFPGNVRRPRRSRNRSEREKWTKDGSLEYEPGSEVGHEEPDGQAKVADNRGRNSGQVRHSDEVATGDTAPANRELTGIGGVRSAITKRDEARSSHGPRERIAAGVERARVAVKRHVYAQGRLTHLIETVRPAQVKALADAKGELARLTREYWALSGLKRGIRIFNELWRVEVAALLAAGFDAFALAKPLQSAGLAQPEDKWVLIVLVAGGIWVAINAIGVAGGMLGLSLGSGSRRKFVTLVLAALAGAMCVGFGLVAALRHGWTEATNEKFRLAAEGETAAPQLLDALFLAPLQIAVAGGAAVLIAVFVMGHQGRAKLKEIDEAKEAVRNAEEALAETDRLIGVERGAVEAADVAINEIYADREAAAVELDVVREIGRADREGEKALTEAAIGRQEWMYRFTRQLFENGGVHLMQRPDTWWRPVRRSPACAADNGAQRPPQGAPEDNGHRHTSPEDAERFADDINNQEAR